ncbi:MAG: cation transporting ATPase C-terminal domain-containing protein, partial [Lacibacter sp.]
YKNNLVPLIIGITLLFIAALIYVPFIRNLFNLNQLSISAIGICAAVAMLCTLWIEVWKFIKRSRS